MGKAIMNKQYALHSSHRYLPLRNSTHILYVSMFLYLIFIVCVPQVTSAADTLVYTKFNKLTIDPQFLNEPPKQVSVLSLEQCQTLCQSDQYCTGFDFYTSAYGAYLCTPSDQDWGSAQMIPKTNNVFYGRGGIRVNIPATTSSATPRNVNVPAGTYRARPIGTSNSGDYDALRLCAVAATCAWTHIYGLSSATLGTRQYGTLRTYSTEAAALNVATTAYFSVSDATELSFFVPDPEYTSSDNVGGVSLMIEAVAALPTALPGASSGWELACRAADYIPWSSQSDILHTASFGMFVYAPQAVASFCRPFDPAATTELMFITGNGQYWALAHYSTLRSLIDARQGDPNANINFLARMGNGASEVSTAGNVYSRHGVSSDPKITVGASAVVWYEGADSTALKDANGGINVYVRNSQTTVSPTAPLTPTPTPVPVTTAPVTAPPTAAPAPAPSVPSTNEVFFVFPRLTPNPEFLNEPQTPRIVTSTDHCKAWCVSVAYCQGADLYTSADGTLLCTLLLSDWVGTALLTKENNVFYGR
eukprot:PhM_4_TR8279/c0_g1_i1/m.53467